MERYWNLHWFSDYLICDILTGLSYQCFVSTLIYSWRLLSILTVFRVLNPLSSQGEYHWGPRPPPGPPPSTPFDPWSSLNSKYFFCDIGIWTISDDQATVLAQQVTTEVYVGKKAVFLGRTNVEGTLVLSRSNISSYVILKRLQDYDSQLSCISNHGIQPRIFPDCTCNIILLHLYPKGKGWACKAVTGT